MTQMIPIRQSAVLPLLIVISFSFSAWFYPLLPVSIATHWNIAGAADGFSSKAFGLFLFPGLLIFLWLLFTFLPRIDPFKDNVRKFWGHYSIFITVLFIYVLYLQALVIAWNSGFRFDFIQLLSPAFTVLFFSTGNLLQKSKRNWFIGIRTPWTLSSDEVWDKTHQAGSKLFKLAALFALGGLLWPHYAIWFILVPVLSVSLVATVYSYLLFRHHTSPSNT